MIEQRQNDLVAWSQLLPDCPRYRIRQGGHVRSKNDLVRIAVKKIAHCSSGASNHPIRVSAGLVGAAGIGIVSAQVLRYSVNHTLGNLRPTRPIEEHCWLAVHGLRQRREL